MCLFAWPYLCGYNNIDVLLRMCSSYLSAISGTKLPYKSNLPQNQKTVLHKEQILCSLTGHRNQEKVGEKTSQHFKAFKLHDIQLTNWFLYFSYCLINHKREIILGSKQKINHSFYSIRKNLIIAERLWVSHIDTKCRRELLSCLTKALVIGRFLLGQ